MAAAHRSASRNSEGPSAPSQVSPAAWLGAIVAATLLGFALRLYRLDGQSLWYDEGFSVALSSQDLVALFHTIITVENHPPLHVLLLHGATGVLGTTEFAVRFPSVAASTLVIPVLARLVRRMAGPKAGLLAGLLAATSPFYVYYAQEARMYALLLLFSVLALDTLAAALTTDRAGLWLRFALVSLLALATHYLAVLLLPGATILVGLRALWHRQRLRDGTALTRPALALLGIIAGYAPWLPVVAQQLQAEPNYFEGTLSPAAAVTWVVAAFGGVLSEAPVKDIPAHAWTLLGLVIAGALALIVRHRSEVGRTWPGTSLVLVVALAVPVLLALALVQQHPKFHPRYLIMASPAYYGLAAAGAVRILEAARRWRLAALPVVVLLALIGGTWSSSLARYYHDPAAGRDDWRGLAAYLRTARSADEPILLVAGYAQPVFRYYFHGPEVYGVPDRPILRISETVDQAELERIYRLIDSHSRVWVVSWQRDVVDPAGVLVRALEAAGEPEPGFPPFHGIGVQAFRLRGQPLARTTPSSPFWVDFAGQVELLGYDLPDDRVISGDAVAVRLYWKASDHMGENYKAVLRLLDQDGLEWGRADQRPAGDANYTRRWRPGARFSADFQIPVEPGTPPGEYQLELFLYNETNLEPLPANVEGRLVQPMAALARVRVVPGPAPASILAELQPVPEMPGDLALLGFAVSREAAEAGEPVELTLGWQARQTLSGPLDLRLSLRDASGAAVVTQRQPLFSGPSIPVRWPGEGFFLTRHRVATPPDGRGSYTLTVAVLPRDGSLPIVHAEPIAELQIAGRAPRYDPPPAAVHLGQRFGSDIELAGYTLDRTQLEGGDRVKLTLVWHALRTPRQRYKVFVHFIDEQQRTIAQQDGEPASGTLATVRWLPGEYIVDDHVVPLPADTPPGTYRLAVGLYQAPAGARLPVGEGDSLVLPQTVRIVPRTLLRR